jgi:hypothetical protein
VISREDSGLGVVVPKPNLPLTERSELKVLEPAKVWAPVVTIPPSVAFAGVKFNTPAVMLAPFELEVLEIAPSVIAVPEVPEVPEGMDPEVTSLVVGL